MYLSWLAEASRMSLVEGEEGDSSAKSSERIQPSWPVRVAAKVKVGDGESGQTKIWIVSFVPAAART
jgi:hypothetical protein